jgi:hypothetical protein
MMNFKFERWNKHSKSKFRQLCVLLVAPKDNGASILILERRDKQLDYFITSWLEEKITRAVADDYFLLS